MTCRDCPRRCGAERLEATGAGACGMGLAPVVARAALHFWEEPCLSGTRGSGAVFFSGCALRCCYCQNRAISEEGAGAPVTVERLREIYRELAEAGAHNINLVTASHFVRAVAQSLSPPPPLPVVYNCGGYESLSALRLLEGKVQVYLPDLKYLSAGPALRYSGAADYPQVAKAAILEMYRQRGPCRFGADGMLESGVLVRHLMLPGQVADTLDVIDWVADAFPKGAVLLSLMAQYVPLADGTRFPELARRLSRQEYARVEAYLRFSPLEDGYLQEPEAATEEYIPEFNLQGVIRRAENTPGAAAPEGDAGAAP